MTNSRTYICLNVLSTIHFRARSLNSAHRALTSPRTVKTFESWDSALNIWRSRLRTSPDLNSEKSNSIPEPISQIHSNSTDPASMAPAKQSGGPTPYGVGASTAFWSIPSNRSRSDRRPGGQRLDYADSRTRFVCSSLAESFGRDSTYRPLGRLQGVGADNIGPSL